MAATASALALPAEPTEVAKPHRAEVDHCEPTELRRAPVPVCDPPFEDEGGAGSGPSDDGSVGQTTLALGFSLPGGLPVTPGDPAGLSTGTHRRLQLVPGLKVIAAEPAPRRKARRAHDDFGPQQTPRAKLPEPKLWAGRLVQAMVEVTSGVRPVSQLVRWTSTEVYNNVQRRIAHAELVSQRGPGGRRLGAIVRSIHIDEPADGVAEICAVVQQGARCRAIALRLEGFDGRWQCTALQVG